MSDSIFFKRKSMYAFTGQPVSSDTLDKLFEIIRWTPSCANKQPWKLLFAVDEKVRAECMTALPRGNQWAGKAPVLAVIVSRPEDDAIRDDDPIQYYQFDCGMAVMSLMLGATELGLMTHPMAGYDANGIKKALSIPAEYHVICVIAIGYHGDADKLDERTLSSENRERSRKTISEIIAIDRFEWS